LISEKNFALVMIYNHAGKTVGDYHYTDTFESRCPICEGPLVGKRYHKKVIWHWAHKPKHRADCPHFESHWHLLAKIAQRRIRGWVIEHPIDLGHKMYRVDAYHTPSRTIREFVHTATPYYYQKHLDLRKARHDRINWVYDGEQFVSLKSRWTRDIKGRRDFLRPTPLQLFNKIGGLVHWRSDLWKHWDDNIWYPYEHPDAKLWIGRLADTRKDLEEFGPAFMIQTERSLRHPEQDGSSAVPAPPSADQSTN
jgi:hypothetical protein